MCFYSRLVQNGKKVEIGALTSLCKKVKRAFIVIHGRKEILHIFQ